MAAATIEARRWSFRKYQEIWKGHRAGAVGWARQEITGYHHAVAETWQTFGASTDTHRARTASTSRIPGSRTGAGMAACRAGIRRACGGRAARRAGRSGASRHSVPEPIPESPLAVPVLGEPTADDSRAALDDLTRPAILAPEPVPESLLAVPVLGAPTADDSRAVLDDLTKYSLARRDPATKTFLLHRLILDVTRRGLTQSQTERRHLTDMRRWAGSTRPSLAMHRMSGLGRSWTR